ncbi:MAG TPA: two-component regulator propeller domain-containing protein, partial [Saprospiraceae bacterium]|nr:two-component regulator propeller domain-containing protein [Saprospiraceae bacterium]
MHRSPVLNCLWLAMSWMAGMAQPFTTHIYTANDGLPDAYTLGIYQDHSGYLWIGSNTGLSRFDGQTFITVGAGKLNRQFSSNVVLQDHLGRIWVTYQKSICQLRQDTILAFPTDDRQPMEYIFGAIELSDHTIVALVDHGAYTWNQRIWKRMHFPPPFEGLNCRQVIESPEGRYYNFEQYIAFQSTKGEWTILSPQDSKAFYINLQKYGSALYANRVNGMIRMEGGQVTEIFQDQLSGTTNYNFIIDHRGRFWIATEAYGILVSDPGNEKHLDYRVQLPFNLSTWLLEDRDQNIWATNYEGLIKIKDVQYQRFDGTDHEAFEGIRCLASDADGHLYIASSNTGLFRLDPADMQLQSLPVQHIQGFNSDVVDGMCFDSSGMLWLITRGQKIIQHDGLRAREMTSWFRPESRSFRTIAYHPEWHQLLVASDRLYIGDQNGFKTMGNRFGLPEIQNPRFFCIRKDGSVIVNTLSDGVFEVSPAGGLENISDELHIRP